MKDKKQSALSKKSYALLYFVLLYIYILFLLFYSSARSEHFTNFNSAEATPLYGAVLFADCIIDSVWHNKSVHDVWR